MKLKWVDDGWRSTAQFLGLWLKAFADGDWWITPGIDPGSAPRADPPTMDAAKEAAEAALAQILAKDEGLLGLWPLIDCALAHERNALRADLDRISAELGLPSGIGLADGEFSRLLAEIRGKNERA